MEHQHGHGQAHGPQGAGGHEQHAPGAGRRAQRVEQKASTSDGAGARRAEHAAPRPGEHAGHGAAHVGKGGDESPVTRVTPTQIAVVGLLTVLALAGSVVFAAAGWNLTLSAREVGGLVMPPGMIMTRETSAETMRDMAAVDLGAVSYTAPAGARGDRPLEPRLERSL
jgi:hypothetical protein